MKVFLDSNVLVASLVARGTCAELFEHVLANHDLGVDDNLLEEIERVLRLKIRVPADRVDGFTSLLRRHGQLVDTVPLPDPVCRDPDDDRVLALCRARKADVLVTGDADLLVLDRWDGLRILAPKDFWPFEAGAQRS